MLDLIFTQELNAEQKKELLENDYNIQMSEEIKEEFDTMCDFSKGFFQDGISVGVKQGIAEGIDIGVERGINIGRAEGIDIGIEREKSNTIKKLLRQFDPSQISSMLDIPLDEVEKVKRSIVQN